MIDLDHVIAHLPSQRIVGPRVALYAIFLLALASVSMLVVFNKTLLSLGPAETIAHQTNCTGNTRVEVPQNATNHEASHEMSSAMQLAIEFDEFSNLANYTWENSTSHRWVPPQNLPHLTRRDMVKIFSNENTLWIGDSTARQDYHTLYWLLRETNQSEAFQTDGTRTVDLMDHSSLDFTDAGPQYKKILEQNKNINFDGSITRDELWCPARGIPKVHWKYLVNVGMVADDHNQERCAMTNSSKPRRLALTGKLDYVIAKNHCLKSVQTGLIKHKPLLERYSIIVFSVGLVNSVDTYACHIEESPSKQVNNILDFLRQEIAGPERTVIWKLHAPGRVSFINATVDQEMAEATRNWFENNEDATGMELADFRYGIRERTAETGMNRIWGDHPLHWGLNARLLCIDLVSRIIARTLK